MTGKIDFSSFVVYNMTGKIDFSSLVVYNIPAENDFFTLVFFHPADTKVGRKMVIHKK
jgi:hypothetical protein